VLIRVGPGVGQIDLASLWPDIGKGIQNVSELPGRQVLRIEVATINSLQQC
jgi:hypothetical protein